jgi:hypothetical protein
MDFYAALFVVIELEWIELDNALGFGDGHQVGNIIHNTASQFGFLNRYHELRIMEAD